MSRARTILLSLLLPVAILGAGLFLDACGGSSSPADPASEQASEQEAETRFADFARCLREHGVNAEAQSRPGGGHGLKISPGSAGNGPAAMEAAEKACRKYRPEPKKINLSPQEKVKREEEVLRFARCMREHGIDVQGEVNGGAIRIGIHAHGRPGEGSNPNPESPAFQAAQKACSGYLPFKGGPGPGHAQGGPPATGKAASDSASGEALSIGG
ncbi:MAG: hypothetical protein ACLQBB_15940 [Solirubrobacteraceae bacterium]